MAFDNSEMSARYGTEIAGVLGYSFLRKLALTLDYRTGLVKVEKPEPPRILNRSPRQQAPPHSPRSSPIGRQVRLGVPKNCEDVAPIVFGKLGEFSALVDAVQYIE